ncbi:hypothetical protein D1007_55475 [Hordeum vulgare]|nr:hypothetical protein D1007_55475 [Hordeum vulgare]
MIIDRKLDDNEGILRVVPLSDLEMDASLSENPIERLPRDNREFVDDNFGVVPLDDLELCVDINKVPVDAAGGLGFYHIDIHVAAESNWLNYKNCAIIKVIKGEVSTSELLIQLNGIFCKNKEWPWQIRELEEKKFLLRFPPWKNVNNLIDFPAFELPIDGVSVKICEWQGMLDPFGELTEAWVQIEGIPPKWCAWKIGEETDGDDVDPDEDNHEVEEEE